MGLVVAELGVVVGEVGGHGDGEEATSDDGEGGIP